MDGINSPRRIPSQTPVQEKPQSSQPEPQTGSTEKPASKSAWANTESWFEATLGRKKGGVRQAGQLLEIIRSATLVAGSLTGKVPAIAGKALDDISLGNVSSDTRPEALLQSTATKAEPDSPLPPSTPRKPATPTTEALSQLLDNAEKTLSTLDKKTATLTRVVKQLQGEYDRLTTPKPQWWDPFQGARLEAADRYQADSVVKPKLEKAQQLLADHNRSARAEKKATIRQIQRDLTHGMEATALNLNADTFSRELAGKYKQATLNVWNRVSDLLNGLGGQANKPLEAAFANLYDKYEALDEAGITSDESSGVADEDGDKRGWMHQTRKEVFGEKGPTHEAVHQGMIGDCFFLGQLAGVAQEDPDLIRSGIRERTHPVTGDTIPNQFEVRFFEQDEAGKVVEVWVSVDALNILDKNGEPMFADTPDMDRDGREEIWVQLYEKAYAAYRSDTKELVDGLLEIDQGGGGHEAYFSLTGKTATPKDVTRLSDAELVATLAKTNPNPPHGQPVMIGSKGRSDRQEIAQGIPGNHAFQVLQVRMEQDSGEYKVMIRNPWGHTEPGQPANQGDGIFEISLDEFRELFFVVIDPDKPIQT